MTKFNFRKGMTRNFVFILLCFISAMANLHGQIINNPYTDSLYNKYFRVGARWFPLPQHVVNDTNYYNDVFSEKWMTGTTVDLGPNFGLPATYGSTAFIMKGPNLKASIVGWINEELPFGGCFINDCRSQSNGAITTYIGVTRSGGAGRVLPVFSGYLESIGDSLKTYTLFSAGSRLIDAHNYQIDERCDSLNNCHTYRVFSATVTDTLDASGLTGDLADTIAICIWQENLIIDENDSVIFSFDQLDHTPLDSLDLTEVYAGSETNLNLYPKRLDLTHGNDWYVVGNTGMSSERADGCKRWTDLSNPANFKRYGVNGDYTDLSGASHATYRQHHFRDYYDDQGNYLYSTLMNDGKYDSTGIVYGDARKVYFDEANNTVSYLAKYDFPDSIAVFAMGSSYFFDDILYLDYGVPLQRFSNGNPNIPASYGINLVYDVDGETPLLQQHWPIGNFVYAWNPLENQSQGFYDLVDRDIICDATGGLTLTSPWDSNSVWEYQASETDSFLVLDTAQSIVPAQPGIYWTSWHIPNSYWQLHATMKVDSLNGCPSVVGVPKDVAFSKWKIYPNPTTGNITIEGLRSLIGTDLMVYDIYGRKQLQLTITASSMRIDMNDLAGGMYLLVSQYDPKISYKVLVED